MFVHTLARRLSRFETRWDVPWLAVALFSMLAAGEVTGRSQAGSRAHRARRTALAPVVKVCPSLAGVPREASMRWSKPSTLPTGLRGCLCVSLAFLSKGLLNFKILGRPTPLQCSTAPRDNFLGPCRSRALAVAQAGRRSPHLRPSPPSPTRGRG